MSGSPDAVAAVAAIEFRGLVKDFSVGLRGLKLRALDRLELSVPRGEIFGLLGPNGSGKSTAIKLALGLLTPTAGTCQIFGQPSTNVETRRSIGYLPEAPDFYRHLTGRELLRFYARMCEMRGAEMEGRIDQVLTQVGLAAAAERRVGTYSKGMLQRVGLAQAIVHDPQLVILDEPTAGLDPIGVAAVSELILQLKAQGQTVLITSHLLTQIEEICDRIAIIDRGRLLLEGPMPDVLQGDENARAVEVDRLTLDEMDELRAWFSMRGRELRLVEPRRIRLDKLFVARVGRP